MNGFMGECKKQHVKELSLGGAGGGTFANAGWRGSPRQPAAQSQETGMHSDHLLSSLTSSQQQAPLLKHLLRASCGSHHSLHPLSSLSPAACLRVLSRSLFSDKETEAGQGQVIYLSSHWKMLGRHNVLMMVLITECQAHARTVLCARSPFHSHQRQMS